MIDEPQEILAWCMGNWHKILVVLIAMIHVWKFFVEYIRPVVHKDNETVIKIPKEGVTITIKPLD